MQVVFNKDFKNLYYKNITPLKYFQLASILLMFSFIVSGCALTKDYVVLSYDPQVNVEKIKGAESIKLKVEISDVRIIKDKVSNKINSYGMEMAPIIASNDPIGLIKKAMETELKNRGFNLTEGSVLVFGELNRYYNSFGTGFWSGKAVGEVVMNIQVKTQDNKIIFSKSFAGEFKEKVQLASGKNAKYTLDNALKDTMSKLFSDASFIDSIFKASIPITEKPQTIDPKSKPSMSTTGFPSSSATTTIVTGTSANIRSGAGNEFSIVATVKQGDKLFLLGEYGEWFNVRLESGQEGWISNIFAK